MTDLSPKIETRFRRVLVVIRLWRIAIQRWHAANAKVYRDAKPTSCCSRPPGTIGRKR